MSDSFWLSDEQFGRLAPLLPSDTRGVPRVDDRRVISGIIHVLQSGCRWKDAPAHYGPHKTLYDRFVRWARKGVWDGIFARLAEAGGAPATVMLDSAHVKAHRSAAGGKGGRCAGDRANARWTNARWTNDQDPCRRRRARSTTTADHPTGSSRRCAHGDRPHRRHGTTLVSCRWRLRQRRPSTPASRQGHHAGHPQQSDAQTISPVRSRRLPTAQCHRTYIRPAQGLASHRHTIRQTRPELHGRRRHRHNRHILVMSPEPSASVEVHLDDPP